jgi:hypothetical protein
MQENQASKKLARGKKSFVLTLTPVKILNHSGFHWHCVDGLVRSLK